MPADVQVLWIFLACLDVKQEDPSDQSMFSKHPEKAMSHECQPFSNSSALKPSLTQSGYNRRSMG